MCVLQLTILPTYLSSLILQYTAVCFFCFKPLVTLLTAIDYSLINEAGDLMKTVQLFNFHAIANCLKAFKFINRKLWEQVLWTTLTCVKIKHLWLIMATNCIFLKRCQYLNCNNSSKFVHVLNESKLDVG